MTQVTLTNNAEHKALTTLARLKIFLGKGSDNQDQLFTMLINQVTAYIERYTKRRFLSQTYTQEVYDGTGTKHLILKNFPVRSVSALEQNLNPDNTASWETIATKDYFIYGSEGRIAAYSYTFDQFLQYPQRYRATYVAGYLIDFDNENDVTKHDLPEEIEYACLKLCSALVNTRKAEGFQSSRIGDLGVVLKPLVFGDPETEAILNKYVAPSI